MIGAQTGLPAFLVVVSAAVGVLVGIVSAIVKYREGQAQQDVQRHQAEIRRQREEAVLTEPSPPVGPGVRPAPRPDDEAVLQMMLSNLGNDPIAQLAQDPKIVEELISTARRVSEARAKERKPDS